jgi:hypothetical protein
VTKRQDAYCKTKSDSKSAVACEVFEKLYQFSKSKGKYSDGVTCKNMKATSAKKKRKRSRTNASMDAQLR